MICKQNGKKSNFAIYNKHIRLYREVLRETMKQAFDHFNLPYDESDVEAFAASTGHWKPFPDTRDAILELQKLLKVVLTSWYRYLS